MVNKVKSGSDPLFTLFTISLASHPHWEGSRQEQVAQARHLYADKTKSIEEICSALGISRATFYRYLKDAQAEEA